MYEVIRTLATGHQGEVSVARSDDGRLVALKRLTTLGTGEDRRTAERRLRREAELLGGLQVDGVVPLLDVFEEEGPDGPEVVLVMPYLPGGTLQQRVTRSGPLPPGRLGELAVPLLRAVASLHRHGVVHRDIKPSNVLFDAEVGGRPWLVDLGIGTSRDVTRGLSADGHLLGTPAFIAPERARGEDATPASDVYSLGATLRYALSGMPPHGIGDVVSVVARAAAGRIEPLPPQVPASVVDLLDRMCAPDPADRPSAVELLPGPEGTAVAPVAGWSPGPTAPPAPSAAPTATGGDGADRSSRWLRPAAFALGATFLLLAGVGLGMAAADRGGDGSEPVAAADDPIGDAEPAPDAIATTTTTTEPACVDLPYQPCNAPGPAPGTDGTACLDGRVDHDDDPTNGCEAVPDDIDDAEMVDGRIEGTIIPVGDVDKVLVPVTDRWQFFCDAELRLSLTAPDGLDLEMQVFDRGEHLATVEAPGGTTATTTLREPSCRRDDSTTLEIVIRGVAGRSPEPWILEKEGSW